MDKSDPQLQNQDIEFHSPPSDCIMADEWYEFATINHFWIKWRFKIIQRMIPENYILGDILDIGCGNGVVMEQIKKRYGCNIVGCDLNLNALKNAISIHKPLYFYNIHQRREELMERFQTILALDVLEHVNDPVSFLDSVKYHLKRNGLLIINVPALRFIYSQYDSVQGHVKRYTVKDLKRELHLSGFFIEDITFWGMSMIPILLIRKFMIRFYREDKVMKVGFQPRYWIIDLILRALMQIECFFLPKPPIGTSLLAIARKM